MSRVDSWYKKDVRHILRYGAQPGRVQRSANAGFFAGVWARLSVAL